MTWRPTSPLLILPVFVLGCTGQAPYLTESVTYYFGAFNNCGLPASQDASGDWSFPARGGVGSGSAACLTAQVAGADSNPVDGFVLWQMCGDPPADGATDCIGGTTQWVPRTGEDWTPLVNGEYATASHSTLACAPAANQTRGFRFLYSRVNPNESNGVIHPSEPFDVTSDGNQAPPDGCP